MHTSAIEILTGDERALILATADEPNLAAPSWVIGLILRADAGLPPSLREAQLLGNWFASQRQVQDEATKVLALLYLHAPMNFEETGEFPGWHGTWWAFTLQHGSWAERLGDAVGAAEAWLMGFAA